MSRLGGSELNASCTLQAQTVVGCLTVALGTKTAHREVAELLIAQGSEIGLITELIKVRVKPVLW